MLRYILHHPGGDIEVEERWYAPLQNPRLLVHEIEVYNPSKSATLSVQLSGQPSSPTCNDKCRILASSSRLGGTADLNLSPIRKVPDGVFGLSGTNIVPELKNTPLTRIAIAANIPPNKVTLAPQTGHVVFAIQAVVIFSNDLGKYLYRTCVGHIAQLN